MIRFFLIVNLLAFESFGADWNQFRGPTGQGHALSDELPMVWGREEGIIWRMDISGKAWSSPIQVGNQVVLSNARQGINDDTLYLEAIALNLSDGSEAWRKELFHYSSLPRIHSKNSYASPTPYFDGSFIYFHFGNLGTACLSMSGEVEWATKLEYQPVHGSGASPVVHGDKILLSTDGEFDPCLLALNKTDGNSLWKAYRQSKPKKSFSFCTPLVIEENGKVQIISPASDYVFSYDLEGKQIWKSKYPGGYSVVPRPIHSKGIVYVSSGYDRPTLYAIRVDGVGEVTNSHVVWKTSKSAPRNSSPVLVHELLFMAADNGVVSCLDRKNGNLIWIERVANSCSASLLHANGLIYLSDEQGKTFIFEAAREFRLLAENDLEERILASPVVIEHTLVLRTENSVWRVGN